MKNHRISNETVREVVDYLSVQLSKSGVKYDYVVGIGRGGLIPATMLAYKLHVPVLSYSIKTYDHQEQTKSADECFYQTVDFDRLLGEGLNILVVDDICDSGNTFELIKDIDKPKVNIETYLSIFAKKNSVNIPDYIGLISDENIWLTFPWE